MRSVALALGAAFVLALGGCGGDDAEEPADQGSEAPQQEAKQGGDLVVMYAADVDKIDPGQTYYQYGMNVAYATQRPLYSYKPDDASNLEPDLAEGPPEIAEDGKSVTVKIRTGVKFSPPVNREVTSADVKYGLERGWLPTVAGPYVNAYMGSLKGLKAFQDGKADRRSRGSRPPTIRRSCSSSTLRAPPSWPRRCRCRPRRRCRRSTRRSSTSAADGVRREPGRDRPVHGRGRRVGQAHRLHAGQSEIKLVRNPNWDASTDYKPAYVDSITIKEGNDPDVASRQILEGQGMVSGDFQLPAAILKSVSEGDQKDLMELSPPTGRFRYIAVRTDRPPFDNVDVRKALNALIDKEALRQAFGGPITGDIPTHFIPPGPAGLR